MADDRKDRQRERDVRPSPEALLKQAAQEGRGRLKVFLGAAPGVGKTFEMLETAQTKRREGVDIVAGVVETHGRAETQALLHGLDVIPRRPVAYKNHALEEMDLDAILARRPEIVLVDELAHTNAPGSRHPKRYLDVEELLAAGINVYTTLNIQHLESLSDVVAKITRIRVRETVPDSVIDKADDIEVVDLTPEDLIQRLKEGKVYVPEQAERAVRNYFLPGNLTALRELALRRTAQRVDDQMITYMRAHAIPGPWFAGERILVCVNERPGSLALVRHARRLAERLRATWSAIYVETPRSQRLSESDRDRVAESLRLAQQLGAEAITTPATDVAGGVIDHAQAHNVTHIIIAKSRRSRFSELWRPSITHQIIRRAGDISVHVIAEEKAVKAAAGAPQSNLATTAPKSDARDPKFYAGTLGIVAAALGVGLFLRHSLAVSNISLVFLTAVLASAVAYGLWPSLFACLVSVLVYNFFFLEPVYTFTISDPENVVTLFFFGVVAIIAGNLTARMRAQALAAVQRAHTTEALYTFSRKLAGAPSMDDLLWATAYQIASMLKMRVVLLLPEGDSVGVRAGYPPEDALEEADLAAAKWAWQNKQAAGRGADTLPGARWLFLPMRTGRGQVGLVGLDSDRPGPLLPADGRRLLDALIDQAALGIERVILADDIERTRLTAETERLRAALLTSISHDLRTPLATILGAATSLKTYKTSLDEAARDELTTLLQEESERLNRFIANLLDMTRLESGKIEARTELIDLGDVVGSALGRAAKVLAAHKTEVDIDANLPLLKLDPVLFEQVLFNLMDNAAKYAPPETTVILRASQDKNAAAEVVTVQVLDQGGGIPPADLEKIFDKFYRVHAGDRKRAGTGLGLAICRGFVETMGGTIVAANRADQHGAIFTITLPVPPAAQSGPIVADAA